MSTICPPFIRPLEQFELRLPHEQVMRAPAFASDLAKKYLILSIGFGGSNRLRDMSRRGIVDWVILRIGEHGGIASHWNGRRIPIDKMDVALCLMAGDPRKVKADDECSWFGSFLKWATTPPRYIQAKLMLRIQLLTLAMMIYEVNKTDNK